MGSEDSGMLSLCNDLEDEICQRKALSKYANILQTVPRVRIQRPLSDLWRCSTEHSGTDAFHQNTSVVNKGKFAEKLSPPLDGSDWVGIKW